MLELAKFNAALPVAVKHIHFIGIGGIGMSALAEIMLKWGYQVSGSDPSSNNYNLARLAKYPNAKLYNNHKAENINNPDLVIYSSAIKKDNPELLAAREQNCPCLLRAELLASLMHHNFNIVITGSHGKTTTTALMGELLSYLGLDPTIIDGGIINRYQSNVHLGESNLMVVEGDESDGTMNLLPTTIGVVTNLDHEHFDHYGDFATLEKAFQKFVRQIPFYGAVILGIDDERLRALLPSFSHPRLVTYGFREEAMVRAENIHSHDKGFIFDALINDGNKVLRLANINLPSFGRHNVNNTLSTIAAAWVLGLPLDKLQNAFIDFKGVERRYTITGEVNKMTVIDDYAHHPVEIKATLSAVREHNPTKNIVAIWQPHRYTRVSSLVEEFANCFGDANSILVADIYSASETPIDGLNQDYLCDIIKKTNNGKLVLPVKDEQDIAGLINQGKVGGDIIIHFGAGNITTWAKKLPSLLKVTADAYEQK